MMACIAKLTNCKLTPEEPVLYGDFYENLQGVSSKSIPDYSMWYLTDSFSFNLKVFFIEIKTDKSLNVRSICQTIGYYMASTTVASSPVSHCPPLALLMSQNVAYLIFFPYTKDNVSCMDAIIVGSLNLDQANMGRIIVLVY